MFSEAAIDSFCKGGSEHGYCGESYGAKSQGIIETIHAKLLDPEGFNEPTRMARCSECRYGCNMARTRDLVKSFSSHTPTQFRSFPLPQMAGLYPPPFLNTQEDRGATVAVISFTSIAVSTLTNSIRVWVRQRSNSALGIDDALLVAANVSGAAGTWDC